MPTEPASTTDGPTGAADDDRPAGQGVGPVLGVLVEAPKPQSDQAATLEPGTKTKALCRCGRRVLARGMCSTCYSRERDQAIRAGSWIGQPSPPGLVLSDKGRAALSVLRIFRASKGYWPMGQELLQVARRGEDRRNLAAGLLELLHSGITAYQMTIVGLARRVVVPRKGTR